MDKLIEMFEESGKFIKKLAVFCFFVGIAASLINNPNLLILDEPTNGLDPEGIKDLRDLIVELATKEKVAVLISSHNLAELDSFCTHICLIDKGKIIKNVNMNSLKAGEKPAYVIKLNKTRGVSKFLGKDDRITEDGICVYRNNEEIPKLIKELVDNKFSIYEVNREKLSLEEAYLNIVGGK